MTLAIIRKVIRAWEAWRFRRSLPKPSPEAARIAERIKQAERHHKSRRQLRLEMARTLFGRPT